jgi:hypothetical protein
MAGAMRSARLLVVALCALSTRAAAATCPVVRTQLIPLPVYATLPNEGSTYGAMPVFLRVCDENERTQSIIAPSLTFNDVIKGTGTFRVYHYPTDDRALTFVASVSTRINSNVLLQWRDLTREEGALTGEVEARWERSVFYRFFGIGPDTGDGAETSYTRIRLHGGGRIGLNLAPGWNAGIIGLVHHDDVQDIGIPGLPISPRVFPGVPGMTGSTILGQLLDVRFDARPNGDYSERGFFADAAVGPIEGISGSPAFLRAQVFLRGLLKEAEWVTGAARLDWTYVSSPGVPFYDQSTLGGAFLLRGFTLDRFIDQNAWTAEVEQRIRLLTTHIFGVNADWRIDPFVGVGQVYGGATHPFSHPRWTTGVGFRAWVHPNVLGRVDVATGGEGIKVYVELGYPY